MDKQFLKEHNLLNARDKFMRMVEYSPKQGVILTEEELPTDNDPSAQGGAPAPDGGVPSPDGGAAPAPASDGGQGVPEFNPQGEGAPADGGVDPSMDEVPQEPVAPQPEMGGSTEAESGDEVIDVDDLTDAQEETEEDVKKSLKGIKHTVEKLGNLDDKLEQVMQLINKFESDIDANNKHIEELEQEFQKRNPTTVEKMSLRTRGGYPFTQSTDEFWDKKESEGVYSTADDENGKGAPQYQITKAEVDSINDWPSISKAIENGGFHQSLKDLV